MSAAPVGVDIWKSCRFLDYVLRSLRDLPRGIHRFLPCDIGGNHGHVLTSRPRGTSSRVMFGELLSLLGCPLHSGDAVLGGRLSLRYCMRRFGARVPSWRLPLQGAVGGLVTRSDKDAGMVGIPGAASGPAPACDVSGGAGGCWVERAGGSCQKDSKLQVFSRFGKHQGSSTLVEKS